MKPLYLKMLFAVVLAGAAGWLTQSWSVAGITLAVLAVAAWMPIYLRYAKDNPSGVWFKRKLFGWGWTPVTWQGWLIIVIYLAAVGAFALTLDESSPPREVAFTFWLPAAFLTALLIRIAYRKGERPRWQWGRGLDKYQ